MGQIDSIGGAYFVSCLHWRPPRHAVPQARFRTVYFKIARSRMRKPLPSFSDSFKFFSARL